MYYSVNGYFDSKVIELSNYMTSVYKFINH